MQAEEIKAVTSLVDRIDAHAIATTNLGSEARNVMRVLSARLQEAEDKLAAQAEAKADAILAVEALA